MTQASSHDERREYFRIRNWIIIQHELIDSLDDETADSEWLNQSSPRIELLQELNRLDVDNQAYLGSLSSKQSQLGNYLVNLNKKVDLLTRFMIQSIDQDSQGLKEVDISGGGIRFQTHQFYALDQLIKLEIVLVPECVGLVAFGRVVDCKKDEQSGLHEVAMIFVKLRETDRDAIIKHVFTLQSKQLRDHTEK